MMVVLTRDNVETDRDVTSQELWSLFNLLGDAFRSKGLDHRWAGTAYGQDDQIKSITFHIKHDDADEIQSIQEQVITDGEWVAA